MRARLVNTTTTDAALRLLAPLLFWTGTALAQSSWSPPPEPPVHPQVPAVQDIDADGNRVDDRIDRTTSNLRLSLSQERSVSRRAEITSSLNAPVTIEVVFSAQVTQAQIDAFESMGGRIKHLHRSVSYGWSGTLPRASIENLSSQLGATLAVVVESQVARPHMDEATRTGRVRPVWAGGFAGSANGYSGTSDITIGIVDSGVDDSHTDLAGRAEYWKDFTTDGDASPRDITQHGSHVAGIAVGSGAAFGVGPGTLKYTDSGNMSQVAATFFFTSLIHVPQALMTFTQNSTWVGGGTTSLYLVARTNGLSGGFSVVNNTSLGGSGLSLSTTANGHLSEGFGSALLQNTDKTISRYATTVTVSPYPAVGDGFNVMRGVAPGAKWAGAKVFPNDGSGASSVDIGEALDDLVAQRTAHNIKVVNLSLGITGSPGLDPTLRAKVNTMVANGMVVVCSAGNDGPGTGSANLVDDPARASLAITVGASNDANALTRYTSSGFAAPGADEDMKPDLLAPGGSDYYSGILAVDSNDADAGSTSFSDRAANDYYNIKGTSMSAPFVAGAAALMIDAMQKGGTPWTFSSSVQPLFVKMLLCASATESNAARENAAQPWPTLGRAAAPKDLYEGYGLMNPDAAVEASTQPYSGGTISGTTTGTAYDRRAWGRKLAFTGGANVKLTLTAAATGDYDLYLYSSTPDAKGNPVIVASSTTAGLGLPESITFTPSANQTRYLFVKRVSGSGSWSLVNEVATAACGDGVKTTDEQCDDGNTLDGDCCSSMCATEANGSTCDDGQFCTLTDTCQSGVCGGTGDRCVGGSDCNNTCNEAADSCVSPAGTACASDGKPCTADLCDGIGFCSHLAGNAGAVCRGSAGTCDVEEKCTGSSIACPANGFAMPTVVCRASGGVCDQAESCSGFAAACPNDAFLPSTTQCRSSGGVCDSAENCTGAAASCPADTLASSATICRAAGSVCDAAERCTGSTNSCPADAFATSATVCRASTGVCDAEERCNGSLASCPADALANSTTICRSSAGVCDAEERCNGIVATCPANVFATTATVCRASASVCDAEERCNGAAASCPADSFAASTTVCRSSAGACDAEERCNGAASCPADVLATSATVCRSSTGVCDVAETCSGAAATCPPDAPAPSTVVCRGAVGICDVAERCDGSTRVCPSNAFAGSTTLCRPSAGVCDAEERCSGGGSTCPADAFAGSATICRSSVGICDAEERCSGGGSTCPADAFAGSATICRSSVGICDTEERCSGVAAACPANFFSGSAVLCRASGGICDSEERCNGSGASCPANGFVASGTVCRSQAGICDTAETCNGSAATCPADAVASSSVTCRSSAGICDVAERCDGATTQCPANTLAGSATVCRAAAGICDTEERCNAASASCPSNVFLDAATACRSSAGICDLVESCSGTAASCPGDLVAGTDLVCRSSAGLCDKVETCNGASAACPSDAFAASSVVCRSSSGICDVAESCSGSGSSCPANVFAQADLQCRASSGACDLAEFCAGTGETCPSDKVRAAATACRSAAGECDQPESCDGAAKDCPGDVFVDSGITCTSDGLPCTRDVCSGSAAACAHPPGNAGVVCRDAAGICDVAESCNGSAAACPSDGVAGAERTCRASQGDCDPAEVCNGTAKTCASDTLANAALACTSDGNVCTGDVCTGSSPTCSHPANGAPCDNGVYCDGADTCQASTCSLHAGNPCQGADGDGNCAESCDENADTCSAADPEASACNDGLFCNGADRCHAGVCSEHGPPACPGPDGDGDCAESCDEGLDACSASDPDGSACNDGENCTIDDSCLDGLCAGMPSPDSQCATTTTTLVEALCGDPSGDARVTVLDALIVLRAAVMGTDCPVEVCDYAGGGTIMTTDALAVLRRAVGYTVTPKCPTGLHSREPFSSTTVPETTSTTLIPEP